MPGSFATVVCGFILLMARTKAISQVCGYLILENGIYLFGLLLINSTPLLVEAGIVLDLTVAIFVIGIIVTGFSEIGTLDTRNCLVARMKDIFLIAVPSCRRRWFAWPNEKRGRGCCRSPADCTPCSRCGCW